jgi:hypothetical protein
MKRTLSAFAAFALTAAASVASANVHAGELYPLPLQDNAGTAKTRMQVQDELRTAVAAHQITNGEQSFSGDTRVVAKARSRADVMAEGVKSYNLDMAFYLRG